MTDSKAIGRDVGRICDGNHEHQPLLDGRAKGASRDAPALCRAICRGMTKDKVQRASGVTTMLTIGEGTHICHVDAGEHHAKYEVSIETLICTIGAEEESRQRATHGEQVCDPGVPALESTGRESRLGRPTGYKNKW